MVQLAGLLLAILLVIAAGLTAKSCQDRPSDRMTPQTAQAFSDQIVVLKNVTMVAPKGTVGRTIADWMREPGPGRAYFELGGRQFSGTSLDPSPEARVRIDRFVTLMQDYSRTRAVIVGIARDTGNPQADLTRARQMAEAIAKLIREHGIPPSRVQTKGRISREAAHSSPGALAAERVSLILSR